MTQRPVRLNTFKKLSHVIMNVKSFPLSAFKLLSTAHCARDVRVSRIVVLFKCKDLCFSVGVMKELKNHETWNHKNDVRACLCHNETNKKTTSE